VVKLMMALFETSKKISPL